MMTEFERKLGRLLAEEVFRPDANYNDIITSLGYGVAFTVCLVSKGDKKNIKSQLRIIFKTIEKDANRAAPVIVRELVNNIFGI